MSGPIETLVREGGASEVYILDISSLHHTMTLHYPRAVLLLTPLAPAFVLAVHEDIPTACDEYLMKETAMEDLADRLAEELIRWGYGAYSESERSNLGHGYREGGLIDPILQVGPSPLPLKALARMAGLGFIGRNNLLVTERYGCALAMCAVLTDAPLSPTCAGPVLPTGCGSCDACVRACPTGALSGRLWCEGEGREALVDIAKCACALRCMVACPHTLRYAKQKSKSRLK